MKTKHKVILALVALLSVSIVYAAASYRVNQTACVMINEHSVCYDVSNPTCAYDVFVPTNTATEWSNFRTNKPACMTVWTACGKSCTL